MKQTFEARLISRGPNGAWTFLTVPFNAKEVFGRKAQVPVAGTINGHEFRNSLMPEGDGTHSMMVSKALQAGAKAAAGDVVLIVMELDQGERLVVLPQELQDALATSVQASDSFKVLSYSHRKEFADWIASAKKAETRSDRATRAIELIKAGKRMR